MGRATKALSWHADYAEQYFKVIRRYGYLEDYLTPRGTTGDEAFTSPVYRGVDPVDPDEDSEDYEEDDWQCGYDAGEAKAQADVECQLAGNNQAPTSFSKEYRDGFATGYDDTYFISWADVGFTNAGKDVAAGDPYDDTPPVACDDNKEYQIGYADGWHNAKLESI